MMKTQQAPIPSIDEFFNLLEGKVYEQELAQLREREKITVEMLQSIYDIGVDYYQKYCMKEAEIIFSAYAALCPVDHRGAASLAAIYLELGQFRKALDLLNIVKTYPTADFDETVLNISLCHYKLKEYHNATAMLLIVREESLSEFNQKRYQYLRALLLNSVVRHGSPKLFSY